jgi:hypothetical protein
VKHLLRRGDRQLALEIARVQIDGCLVHQAWTEIMSDDSLPSSGTLREPDPLIWDERLTEADKPLVAQLNESLDRLNGRRAIEINVSERFARSKIA